MGAGFRVSIFVPVLLALLLATLHRSSHGEDGLVSQGSIRSLLGVERGSQIPNCSEMVSKSQCSHNSKCRWCRSHALDDMCFSKSEAWRLPQQNDSVEI